MVCGRFLMLARHYEGTADHDLAAFACRQHVSVAVHDRDADKWRWTTSRREPLARERAVRVHMLLRRHSRDHHRGLCLTKQLTENWTDPADCLLKPGHRHGGSSVPEALQRRQVFRRQVGVPEQHVDKGRWQESMRDPVL